MSLFDVYPLFDVTPVKAKGVYLFDAQGMPYLDLYGGHAVISIGHSHPRYVKKLKAQIDKMGFYSNAVVNPLQLELSEKLNSISNCFEYQLFLCNSGAEANENALKLASFHTKKTKVIAFHNSFHGRTSAAVAATDNSRIVAPINAQQQVSFLALGDLQDVEEKLASNEYCAVIIECIQGVGGLNESATAFYKGLEILCNKYEVMLIADEVQSGFGRTGDFFAFQKHRIKPSIISMAKGMGNGFPVGGILIHPKIKASHGLLGTTFGGNHLACTAVLSVIEVLESENLMHNVLQLESYFLRQMQSFSNIKNIKGRGLMLGLEFDFKVADFRKRLLLEHQIFTGSSKNQNLLRILPPLSLKKDHIDQFTNALNQLL
jgi:acetylornithine aminotransferase